MHWLWRHLDLSIARKRVVPKRVLRLIALSKSSIRKATLHNVYVDDIQLYSDALLTCRDLREISLKYVAPAGVSINMRQPNVREFLASTKEYDEQIVQFRKIVEGCPHLRVAKVSFSDRPHCAPFTMPYMPHLQSFHCVVRSDAEMPRLVFRMMVCFHLYFFQVVCQFLTIFRMTTLKQSRPHPTGKKFVSWG